MEKPNDKFTKCIIMILVIFFNLVFGTLCIVFSTVPGLYGNKEECTDLRLIVLVAGIWFITSYIIKEFIQCFKDSLGFLIEFESIKYLTDLAIMITVWVFLGRDEDCEALTTFVWVWTWIIVAVVGLIILAICGMCCFCAELVKAAEKEDKKNLQTNEQNVPMIQTSEQNLPIEQNNEE